MDKKVKMLLSALLCVSVMSLSGCGKKTETDKALAVADTKSEAMGVEESLDSKSLGISEGRTTEGCYQSTMTLIQPRSKVIR
jgi:peptidoglycan-associated lipoprotein